MKRKKIFFIMTLCFVTLVGTPFNASADYDVRPQKVSKIISTDKNITVGETFELKAKLAPLGADDDFVKWKIVGKKGIVAISEEDKYENDDELELKALKAGTTKVRCSILGKGKKFSKTITIKVKKAQKPKLTRVSKKTIKTEVGDDFDLEVKYNTQVKSSDLQWSIADTDIVDFESWGRTFGKEVEFQAKNIGKTTVTCKNKKTGQKVKFSVEVVYDDDRYDDDWYDDDWYDD